MINAYNRLEDRVAAREKELGTSLILGFFVAVCWILGGILLVIWQTAGDGEYLGAQMLAHASPEETGLPEAEYPGMGRMIAAYLTGKTETFQYRFTDDSGRTRECFHDYEADHMKDCRELIEKAMVTTFSSGFLVVFLTVMNLVTPEKDWTRFFRGILWGIRAVLGIAVILAAWAALNFDGFFVTFHRIAFTNDGWLLDPRTDMLIRLMPAEFFISLGIRGAWLALIAPAAAEAAARIGLAVRKNQASGGFH